jgi:hypothetical protein
MYPVLLLPPPSTHPFLLPRGRLPPLAFRTYWPVTSTIICSSKPQCVSCLSYPSRQFPSTKFIFPADHASRATSDVPRVTSDEPRICPVLLLYPPSVWRLYPPLARRSFWREGGYQLCHLTN